VNYALDRKLDARFFFTPFLTKLYRRITDKIQPETILETYGDHIEFYIDVFITNS
jgi:hypothetical protein